MAKCSICGKSGIFLKIDMHGRCPICAKRADRASRAERILEQVDPEYAKIKLNIEYQNKLHSYISKAREQFKVDNDIDKLIEVYEYAIIKANPPLKNAQSHIMYLAELYIKNNQNDKAWGYLNSILLSHRNLTHKIRFLQCKILKKEKRYVDAMFMLMMGYLFKAKINSTFSRETFIKDVTPIANKLSLNSNNVQYLAYLIDNQVKNHNYDEQVLEDKIKKALADFGIQ